VNARDLAAHARLAAACREGLGLAAIAVIEGAGGIRVAAAAPGRDITLTAADTVHARWWCARAAEAEPIATAAARRLGQCGPGDDAAAQACDAVIRVAKRRHVALRSDTDVSAHTTAIITRIDDELEQLRQSGDLRPVNKSYQTYRREAAAIGERVVPYAQWMLGYKEALVRKLAATLRHL
jgi:hypothetical protein